MAEHPDPFTHPGPFIRSGELGRAPLPVRGYAALVGIYNLGGLIALTAALRHRRLLTEVPVADLLILAGGSHQLGRMVSKDRVTTVFRRPFTRYRGTDGALFGEDRESARRDGGQLRAAIGELVTCPYCSSAWTTGALFSLYLAHRPLGRTVAAFLSTISLTNLAHKAYFKLLRPAPHPSGS